MIRHVAAAWLACVITLGSSVAGAIDVKGLSGTWRSASGLSVEIREVEGRLELRFDRSRANDDENEADDEQAERVFQGVRVPQQPLELFAFLPGIDAVPRTYRAQDGSERAVPEDMRRELAERPARIRIETRPNGIRLIASEPQYRPSTNTVDYTRERNVDLQRYEGEPYCPQILKQAILYDFENSGGLVSNPFTSCVRSTPTPASLSPDSGQSASLGAALLERYIQLHPDLGVEAPPGKSVANRCSIEGGNREGRTLNEALVIEYYGSRLRLTAGIQASFEAIATLERIEGLQCESANPAVSTRDRLLQRLVDEPLVCRTFALAPEAKRRCEQIKQQCVGTTRLNALLEQTELGWAQYQAFADKIKAVTALRDEAEYLTPRRAELNDQIEELEQRQKVVTGAVPWIAGKAFREGYDAALRRCTTCDATSSARVLCGGLVREASARRRTVEKRLRELVEALRCLEDPSAGCSLDAQAFRRVVDRTPPLREVKSARPPDRSDAEQARHASNLLDQAHCRADIRNVAAEETELLRELAISSALTIVTAGTSSIAASLRAGAVGARAGTAVNTARVLELTGILLDVGDFGRGIYDATDRCNQQLELGNPLSAPSGLTCPGDEAPGTGVAVDFTSCVIDASLIELRYALLPLAPAALARIRELSPLRRAAEALGHGDVLRLTPAQQRLIRQVIDESDSMTPKRLRELEQLLREAGIDATDARRLLDQLLPEWEMLGEQLVKNLEGRPVAHASTRFAGEAHEVAMRAVGDRLRVSLCTLCGRALERLDDLLQRSNVTGRAREQLEELRRKVVALEDQAPHLTKAQIQTSLDELAAELRRLDTDEGTRLALTTLARTTREAFPESVSQLHAGDLLRENGVEGLVRERPFKRVDSQPDAIDLGIELDLPPGRQIGDASIDQLTDWARTLEQRLGISIPTQGLRAADWPSLAPGAARSEATKRVKREVAQRIEEALRDSTRPDFFGYELIGGRRVPVAYELKTPREGTLVDFFQKIENSREMNERFFDQIGGRARGLPAGTRNELVLDLRNTRETINDAMLALQRVEGDDAYRSLSTAYPSVRFILGDAGTRRLSQRFDWDAIRAARSN